LSVALLPPLLFAQPADQTPLSADAYHEMNKDELDALRITLSDQEIDLNRRLNSPQGRTAAGREKIVNTIRRVQRQRDAVNAELARRESIGSLWERYRQEFIILGGLFLALLVVLRLSRRRQGKPAPAMHRPDPSISEQPEMSRSARRSGKPEAIELPGGERRSAGSPLADGAVLLQDMQAHVDHIVLDNLDAPYNKLVDFLFHQAILWHASDIHMQRSGGWFEVKYRIDGQLHVVCELDQHREREVLNVVKVMAKLKTYEIRAAQEGRLEYYCDGRWYELRVSVVPTMNTEKIVARIFGDEQIFFDLDRLGFSLDTTERLKEVLQQRLGMALLVGPAGSGKSTTMYAALNHLYHSIPGLHITTLEDPVEHHLEGITQVQINPIKDITFESGFKNLLRQDPEVVMIGEIRETPVAKLVAQAASTGHLVISTVHSYTPLGAVHRMADLIGDTYLLYSSLAAVLSQRLVKQVCMHCMEPYSPEPRFLTRIAPLLEGRQVEWRRGRGCEHCMGEGYRGRIVLDELLIIPIGQREQLAMMDGHSAAHDLLIPLINHTLFEDGVQKAAAGLTTIEEVVRCLGDLAFQRSQP